MNTLEYIFPKAFAIDKVRTKLTTKGIDIIDEKDINNGLGLKFICFKEEKIILVLYFKGEMSSKIVFEKASDEVVNFFGEIQQNETSYEKQQSSVPIHANIKIEKPELQGAIKEKIKELYGNLNFERPKETILYKTTITKDGVRFTLTQYKNGTLLLQGASSMLFEEIKQIINDINPITNKENALLFVPREEKKQ